MSTLNLSALLFMFFYISTSFANDFLIEVSQSQNITLKNDSWVQASGSFYPGDTVVNVYSHKNKQELQVFFEDLYIPKALLQDKLPKSCANLTEKSKSFCKSEKTEGKNVSVTYTSVFPLKQKNLIRVRSVFLIGKKQDLSKIIPVDRSPASKAAR